MTPSEFEALECKWDYDVSRRQAACPSGFSITNRVVYQIFMANYRETVPRAIMDDAHRAWHEYQAKEKPLTPQ